MDKPMGTTDGAGRSDAEKAGGAQAARGERDGLDTVLGYLTAVPAWYLATSVDG